MGHVTIWFPVGHFLLVVLWRMKRLLVYGELANKSSTRTCPLYYSEQAGNEDRGQRVSTTVAIKKQDESNDEQHH